MPNITSSSLVEIKSDDIHVFTGTSGPDIVSTKFHEIVNTGPGKDTIFVSDCATVSGGADADRFVLQPSAEFILITDFNKAEGDEIDLSAFVGIKGPQDFARAPQIWAGGGTCEPTVQIYITEDCELLLEGMTVNDLNYSAFRFASSPPPELG